MSPVPSIVMACAFIDRGPYSLRPGGGPNRSEGSGGGADLPVAGRHPIVGFEREVATRALDDSVQLEGVALVALGDERDGCHVRGQSGRRAGRLSAVPQAEGEARPIRRERPLEVVDEARGATSLLVGPAVDRGQQLPVDVGAPDRAEGHQVEGAERARPRSKTPLECLFDGPPRVVDTAWDQPVEGEARLRHRVRQYDEPQQISTVIRTTVERYQLRYENPLAPSPRHLLVERPREHPGAGG